MTALTMLHFGHVDDTGTLVFEDKRKLNADIRSHKGKRVEMVLRLRRSQRSIDQNAWLWGVALEMLVEEAGYEKHERRDAKEYLHYKLVSICFGMHWDARLKTNVPNKRSSHLTTKEFSDYMEWLVRYAAQEEHCVIPLPDEVDLSEIDEASL